MLDVSRVLKFFLSQRRDFRRSDRLFINVLPPNLGLRMSMMAIRGAIRTCICEAYKALNLVPPEGITAHSTCSTVASAALLNRALIEDICKAATWSSVSTFVHHYKLHTQDSADTAFGRRVLQQVTTYASKDPPRI